MPCATYFPYEKSGFWLLQAHLTEGALRGCCRVMRSAKKALLTHHVRALRRHKRELLGVDPRITFKF